MARKKITPEEETPKTVALEESTAADVGDMTQNDLPPGESGTAEDCGTEAVPTTEPAEDADGMSVGGDRKRRAGEKTLRRLLRRKCLCQIFLPRRRYPRPWKNNLRRKKLGLNRPMRSLPRWRACWTLATKMRRGTRRKETSAA